MALFNVLHIILMVLMIVSGIVLFLFFNKNELEEKLNIVEVLCVINMVLTIFRAFYLIFDKSFNYNFFNDFLFNPVDIISISSFIFYIFKKYKHLNLLYYIGIVYSLLMIIFPGSKFMGNIFYLKNLLYYPSLYLNLLICLFTASLYDIKKKDILKNFNVLFTIITIAFCLNTLFNLIATNPENNFFYTMGPSNNLLFGLIYKLIPMGYLYNLIILVLMTGFFFIQYGLHLLLEKPINNLKHKLNKNASYLIIDGKVIKKEIK